MKENAIVELIAEPILEALEAMEASGSFDEMPAVPTIRLVFADTADESVMVGGQPLDEALIRQVESYLQERVMEIDHPTILH